MKKVVFILLSIFLIGCTISGGATKEIIREYGKDPDIYFCPRQNCSSAVFNLLNSANQSIHCAFYDLDLEEIIHILTEKSKTIDVGIVMDNRNSLNLSFEVDDGKQGLMHNKFCIVDGKIILTGSFNPTKNDNYRNNNNLIIFYSENIAKNYESEYKELRNKIFGKGTRTRNPIIYFNDNEIENYFCPEDWCSNRILEELEKAKKSIYFMIFSFTSEEIGDYLIKKHEDGVEIRGIFEKQQLSNYSQYQKLKNAGIDVILDKNKYVMHHKVFIIDNETVITGSFNPTKGGETINDENILIIHSPNITKKYIEEFNLLYT